MYWSHAGSHFEIRTAGPWWAALPKESWPSDALPEQIAADFEGKYGDRRQEIVIIGVNMDQEAIETALKTNGKSPMTNLPMEARFHVNYSLRGIIENAIPKDVKERYAEKQRAAQCVAQSKMQKRKSTPWHADLSRSKMPRRML